MWILFLEKMRHPGHPQKSNSPSCLCNSRCNHHTCLLIVCIHTRPSILPFNTPTSIYSKTFETKKTKVSNLPLSFLGTTFIWVFPKIVVPENGWFIMETPIKMDNLGVPLFFGNSHISPQGFQPSKTSSPLFFRFQRPSCEMATAVASTPWA